MTTPPAGRIDVEVDVVAQDVDVDEQDGPRRRPRTVLAAVVTVGIVVLGLVVVLATRDPATDRAVDSPLLGRSAPPIAGETIGGNRFDLAQHRGQWVVVNFFASWCVPCRREHPELRAFVAEHDATGDAQVVSVIFGDEVEDVRRFFAEQGGDWPVVRDDDGEIGSGYGVAKVPETFIVDPRGTVRAKIVSGVSKDGLDELLADLQGGHVED